MSVAYCAEGRKSLTDRGVDHPCRVIGGGGLLEDWASDVAVLLQAETALWPGNERDWAGAIEQLLPYEGRQAVLGTPALSLGAYDELLGRIAERRGDHAAARRWWSAARDQGHLVGSPHQVALAESTWRACPPRSDRGLRRPAARTAAGRRRCRASWSRGAPAR